MTINTINNLSTSPNFTRNKRTKLVDIQRTTDGELRTYEIEASTGKKWGVGLASALFTGLGQAVNGQWGKAAAFFFGSAVPTLIIIPAIVSKKVASSAKKSGALLGLGIISSIGISLASIVDAVKNAKSTTTQFVPNKMSEQEYFSINTQT